MDRKTGFDYRVPILFALSIIFIVSLLALYTPNPDLGMTDNETNMCEPDAMPVNVTKYYDNESRVCWNPDMNQTQPVNESETSG